MSSATGQLAAGVTPKKLVLIGVLAVILVVVLIVQFGGFGGDATDNSTSPPEVTRRETPRRTRPDASPPPTETSGNASVPELERQPWPKLTAEDVQQHDPFAVSEAMSPWVGPEPAQQAPATAAIDEAKQRWAAQLQETLNYFRTHGVELIIDDGSGPTALIDDRSYRIGDVIGGFRVIDINAREGVVLEIIERESDVH